MLRRLPIILLLLQVTLSGCSTLAGGSSDATPTLTEPPDPDQTPAVADIPRTLTIWVAPQFDPASGTAAGDLFLERLEAFQAARPGLAVLVRKKAVSGPGGLLHSLSSASLAAPELVPDLISLDDHQLNTAALKGHLAALDGQSALQSPPEWIPPLTRDGSGDQNLFGYPFAGDALVLAYDPNRYDEPPFSWSALLQSRSDFLFPAGDPNGSFTLALYLAQGGDLYDETGRPRIETEILVEVLSFYADMQAEGLLPPVVRQYQTAAQSWEAYQASRAGSTVASFHDTALAQPAGPNALPLPTRSGQGVTTFTTWSWAITTEDRGQQALALQLVTWLTEPDFLGAWTEELALIPPSLPALDTWSDGPRSTLASLLFPIGLPRPSEETLATFGPPFHTAVTAVLTGTLEPAQAASQAARAIE